MYSSGGMIEGWLGISIRRALDILEEDGITLSGIIFNGSELQTSVNDLVFDERASKFNFLKGLKVEAKKRVASATLDFLNSALN